MLDSLGPRSTPRAAGEAVFKSRNEAIKAFRAGERVLFANFRPLAEEVPIQSPQLDAFVETLSGQRGSIRPNQGAAVAQRIAKLLGGDVSEDVAALTGAAATTEEAASLQAALQAAGIETVPPVNASEFQRIVSELGMIVRTLTTAVRTDPAKRGTLGQVKRLWQLARADLESSLDVSPPARAAFEEAMIFSRLGNKRLLNEEIERVARFAPEKLAGRLFQKNNSTMIEAVREAVGPDAFQGIQSAVLEDVLRADPGTGRIVWKKVAERLGETGDDTVQALFPGAQAADIQQFVRQVLSLEEKPLSGLGKMFIQLSQGTAFAKFLTFSPDPLSALIVLGPVVLSRIMTNQTALRWLTTGLTAPVGSAIAARVSAQLTSFFVREQQREQEEALGGEPPTLQPQRVNVDAPFQIGAAPPGAPPAPPARGTPPPGTP